MCIISFCVNNHVRSMDLLFLYEDQWLKEVNKFGQSTELACYVWMKIRWFWTYLLFKNIIFFFQIAITETKSVSFIFIILFFAKIRKKLSVAKVLVIISYNPYFSDCLLRSVLCTVRSALWRMNWCDRFQHGWESEICIIFSIKCRKKGTS